MLNIQGSQHDAIMERAVTDIYQEAIKGFISKGKITDKNRAYLRELAEYLGLTQQKESDLYQKVARSALIQKFEQVMADGMLSPAEEQEVVACSRSLGVNLTFDAETRRLIAQHKRMWNIRHGQLPVIEANVNLQRGEACYFAVDVKWHETRKQRVAAGYAGPTMRVTIADGMYWNAGAIGVKPITRDTLVHLDSGRALITNKRIIFLGTQKTTSIPIGKILDFTKYTDGVEITKGTGKNPFLNFDTEIDEFCATLARIINEAW